MLYLKAILLAIIEGVTEFLPISSTGHLKLAETVIDMGNDDDFCNAFIIMIQLPAILAVVVVFWGRLWPFGAEGEKRTAMFHLWGKILVAVIPAFVLGTLFSDFIDSYLLAPIPISAALFIGGVILVLVDKKTRHPKISDVAGLTVKTAFIIGLIQCFAMIPGTSRSAATIIGAMLLGASRSVAAEFSFFLAIPTMVGAFGYKALQSGVAFTGEQWAAIAVGSIVSFLVAYAAVKVFIAYIRNNNFVYFGYYRIALALCIAICVYLGWMNGH